MGVILAALLFGLIVQIMGSLNRSAAESFQSSYNYEQKVSTTNLTDVVLSSPSCLATTQRPGETSLPSTSPSQVSATLDRSNVSAWIGGARRGPHAHPFAGAERAGTPGASGNIIEVPFILSFNAAEENLSPSSYWSFTRRNDCGHGVANTYFERGEPRVQGPV